MIIRRRYTANFTTIGNALFNDERLALDELGLLAWLRSRPDDWEIRRPALMRRFKVGRDGLRRVMRSLLRLGWLIARVTRLSDGTVRVVYEVRDEPGPELSEEEARAALSLVSSGAGPGDSADGDDSEAGTEDGEGGADPPGADPPGTPQPDTGDRMAVSRIRPSPPGPIEDSLKTDSAKTESPNGARAFWRVLSAWPPEHVLSRIVCEGLHAGLTDKDQQDAVTGAKPYISDCRSQNRKVCDLATFYRERRWERFTAAKQEGQSNKGFKVYSPQWYRWRDYRQATNQSIKFMETYAREHPDGMWTIEPTEWPPAMPAKQAEPALSASDIDDFTK